MQTTIPAIRQHGIQRADATQVCLSAEAVDSIPYGRILAQQGDLYFYRVPTVRGMQRMPQRKPREHRKPFTPLCSADATQPRLGGRRRPWRLHGHITFPPGIYGVRFQRAYADELRRVAD